MPLISTSVPVSRLRKKTLRLSFLSGPRPIRKSSGTAHPKASRRQDIHLCLYYSELEGIYKNYNTKYYKQEYYLYFVILYLLCYNSELVFPFKWHCPHL